MQIEWTANTMKSSPNLKEIRKRLRELVPHASMSDFLAIEQIATAGHLRHLPPSIAAWQAVTTVARHQYTDYDEMLDEGYDADTARHFVLDDINDVLKDWGCSRQISAEDDHS